jgi:hypothetical protein
MKLYKRDAGQYVSGPQHQPRLIFHQYGDKLFTFAQIGQWVVVVKAKERVKDFYNAPEDVLSMEVAAEEVRCILPSPPKVTLLKNSVQLLQLQHTVGRQFCDETYHISAIKTSLNQNLADVLPRMVDEIVCGYTDVLDSKLRGGTGNACWCLIMFHPNRSCL